jgi:hypothetical protein
MRLFFSRIIKPLLALVAAAFMMQATQACTKDPKPAEQTPAPTAAAPKAEAAPAPAPAPEAPAGAPRTVALTVTESGYEPSPLSLKKDEPVKLVVTRKTDQTCATEIVMEEYGINTPLPLDKPVEIAFTPTKSGKLTYGCAMGKMISGVFTVD